MAILATPKPVDNNLNEFGFTQSQFKIAVNNKAFKVLIDKLYSNKIKSIIRELSTNAYDAHIMAGCPNRPFDVALPTSLSPVFTIRDYGISMSHEQIMTMYVTIFESTKDDTNTQVGAFGLGSKSPFSYTDSFSVRAYSDGQERSYIVGYDSNGIPTITHVNTIDDSDAETGIEVSFPVELSDCHAFREAAVQVYKFFDVKPNVGLTFDDDDPILSGSNWKLYSKRHYSYNNNDIVVRQGCVGYPVQDHDVIAPLANLNVRIVIDVPIGSVAVTPSRESISMDPETKEYLTAEFTRIDKEIIASAEAEFSKAATLYEVTQVWLALNYIHRSLKFSKFQRPGKKPIEINGYWKITKATRLPTINTFTKGNLEPSAHVIIDDMAHYKIIIDRGQQMLRKKVRLREFVKHNPSHRVIVSPTNKELERLIRVFHIPAENVISITSIPDVEPPAKAGTLTSGGKKAVAKSGVTVYDYETDRQFKPDKDYIYPKEFYWIPTESTENFYGFTSKETNRYLKVLKDDFFTNFRRFAKMIGVTDKPILALTAQAQKRLNPHPDFELTNVIDARCREMADEVREASIANSIYGHFSSYKIPILKVLYPEIVMLRTKFNNYPSTNAFFYKFFDKIITTDMTDEVQIKIDSLVQTYPLLFSNNPTETQIKEYVEFINTKETSQS